MPEASSAGGYNAAILKRNTKSLDISKLKPAHKDFGAGTGNPASSRPGGVENVKVRRTQGLPDRRPPSGPLPLPATPGSGEALLASPGWKVFFSSTTPGPFPGARQRAGDRGDRGRPSPRLAERLVQSAWAHLAAPRSPAAAGGRRGLDPASGCHGGPGPNPARPQPKACPPPASRSQSVGPR